MKRLPPLLLIALVALMALLPQSMCPCAQAARAAGASVSDIGVSQAAGEPQRACCPHCLARLQHEALKHGATGRGPVPRAPSNCPCCAINGTGKYLLQVGDEIRAERPSAASFAPPLPVLTLLAAETAVAVSSIVMHEVVAGSPAEQRAGVVLLI